MILNDNGKPVANLHNALMALRTDPNLIGQFAFDEMEQCVMRRGRALTDIDVGQVTEYLQTAGIPRMGSETVHQAVQQHAHENAFHPIRDYLNGLEWDGTDRLDTWLTDYLGAEANAYTKGVGRAFLIGAVARVMKPGCKLDNMVILEGEQGAGKSTAVAILGGRWFTDSLPDISRNDKDVSQHLRGKWFVEIGELNAMRKAESTALKSFLSRTVEQYRPTYGRLEVREPRQCVIVGTTNQEQYLKDETGGRRFWPVRSGAIDTDALRRDRDQLFAEAKLFFDAGEQWWPDPTLSHLAQVAVNERYDEDPWADSIERHLETAKPASVLVTELLFGPPLNMSQATVTQAHKNRVSAILRRTGWVQVRTGRDRSRRYYPPETAL